MVTIAFEQHKLSNGMDVILHEDHTIPIVAVNVWYHVGSKNEEVGRHRVCPPVRARDVRGHQAPPEQPVSSRCRRPGPT